MTRQRHEESEKRGPAGLSRRELLAYSAAFGSAFLASQGLAAQESEEAEASKPPKQYDMKKSINLWALPYPGKMTLRECLELCKDAGFDGVEVNYALEGDLTPETSDADVAAVGRLAREIGSGGGRLRPIDHRAVTPSSSL